MDPMGYDIIGNFHVVDRHLSISRCFHSSLLWPAVCHGPWRTHGRWTGTGAWGGLGVPDLCLSSSNSPGDLFGIVIWCDLWPFQMLGIVTSNWGIVRWVTVAESPCFEGIPGISVAMAYPNWSSHHATSGTGIRLPHVIEGKKFPGGLK